MRWTKKTTQITRKLQHKSTSETPYELMFDCCICLETNVLAKQKTPCGHSVCKDCQDQMRKPVCPICRAEIPLSDIAYARIESERTQRLKHLCYARIFRSIDADYIQYIEMISDDSDNVISSEWEDIEVDDSI